MGAFEFMVDVSQESQLSDIRKEIKAMQREIATIKQWIKYLHDEMKDLKEKIPPAE